MSHDHFTPLPQSKLKAGAGYQLASTNPIGRVTNNSPALDVMTDLRRVDALTTTDDVQIDTAQKMMIDYGVRSLIVVDAGHRIVGIITATDILGSKPMQLINERGLLHSDILVRDVMTPAARIDVIDLADVANAKVGRVVETLKHSGRQHALVVEQAADGRQLVCGIFSSTQIARQMAN
jgi:CBS-domain-containing membrane protein